MATATKTTKAAPVPRAATSLTSTKYAYAEQFRDLMYPIGGDGWRGFDTLFVQRQPLDTNSATGRRQFKAMKTPKRSLADAADLIHNTDTVR